MNKAAFSGGLFVFWTLFFFAPKRCIFRTKAGAASGRCRYLR
ncbi:hypothetical protein [Azospirillum largimobile]